MYLSELWNLYKADKRILGFSPYTLKAYSLQLNVLGDVLISHFFNFRIIHQRLVPFLNLGNLSKFKFICINENLLETISPFPLYGVCFEV
jgi:hypothetical protein